MYKDGRNSLLHSSQNDQNNGVRHSDFSDAWARTFPWDRVQLDNILTL